MIICRPGFLSLVYLLINSSGRSGDDGNFHQAHVSRGRCFLERRTHRAEGRQLTPKEDELKESKESKKDEKRVALHRVWAFAGDDKSVGRIKFTLISMEIYYYQNEPLIRVYVSVSACLALSINFVS